MIDEKEIVDMYVNKKMSTYAIAEKYNTYPNKIRRRLRKLGIEMNDRSTAQKISLKTGRSTHPTEGKNHSAQAKEKISESIYNFWQNISPEERQKRVDIAKENWNNMSEEERENLMQAASIAIRAAASEGSKMEKFLYQELTRAGYDVLFHKQGLIANQELEIDIFIPSLNTAVEIDGPAHFYPIWGETNLQKHIKADAHKTGLLLAKGFVVVRIKHLISSLSEKHKRDILSSLLSLLEKIKKEFPKKQKRYMELEIK